MTHEPPTGDSWAAYRYHCRTFRCAARCWLALRIKHAGERLSGWVQP